MTKRTNKASVKYTDDYARVLGYIYTRNNEYEKAKLQFELLLAHDECLPDDRIMALYVAEQTNDYILANRIREENLKQVNMEALPKTNEVFALPENIDNVKSI